MKVIHYTQRTSS